MKYYNNLFGIWVKCQFITDNVLLTCLSYALLQKYNYPLCYTYPSFAKKPHKSFIQIEYRYRFRFQGYFHLPIKIWRYAANLFQPLHSHDLIRVQTEQTHAKKPVLVSIQASRSFSIIFTHSRKVRRLVFKLFRIFFRYNFSHLIYF